MVLVVCFCSRFSKLHLFSHSCREQKSCQSTVKMHHHPALSTPLGCGRWMAPNRNVRSRKVQLFHRIRDEACVACLTRSNDILQRWRLVRRGRRGQKIQFWVFTRVISTGVHSFGLKQDLLELCWYEKSMFQTNALLQVLDFIQK